MPFPAMRDTEDDYAQVQGVTVWEGEVGPLPAEKTGQTVGETMRGEKYRWIIECEDGWEVVYQGQSPVAYVRTPIQNPMLGLTASITLRDTPTKKRTHQSNMSIESVMSEATFREDQRDEEPEMQEEDRIGQMEEIDLLGGLTGGKYYKSRLKHYTDAQATLCLLHGLGIAPSMIYLYLRHHPCLPFPFPLKHLHQHPSSPHPHQQTLSILNPAATAHHYRPWCLVSATRFASRTDGSCPSRPAYACGCAILFCPNWQTG